MYFIIWLGVRWGGGEMTSVGKGGLVVESIRTVWLGGFQHVHNASSYSKFYSIYTCHIQS